MKIKKLFRTLLAAAALTGTVTTQAATFYGQRSDFRDETIYFAMTTRFYDGDPMNNVCGWDHQSVQIANNDPDWRGDFKGLIDKLDYIKALGFTTVWITPIAQNCSGTDFHGYHAMDFSNVDIRYESRKEWGSEKDVKFQDLIDAAHAKGMKIVLDIVLNHTGNFGEANLQHLFTRSQNIKDQANISASIIPNTDKLPANYNDLDGTAQYNARFPYLKNTNGQNLDNHNYWHHIATNWNWDLPNRWWGQIAGDCVDLNTENPAVAEYLVKCYGKFIEMGVDGFRIDTTGHISRLTFNTSFIPQFLEIAEKAKDKRLNGCPFFMFGECCQRFQGSVTYRDQPNLSSYFYTWKSPDNIASQWNYDASYWDNVYIKEGDDTRYGNMALCEDEPSVSQTSDNVFMKNGAWHEPDYSQNSGFSTIDFPSHYGFNNAGYVVDLAKGGDKYYNDASFLVVYVDSHDYCPGPNDGTRFNGGTSQWAENLSLMFTFRGIPCIYYGSEVEFQKGCKVDAGGTDTPVKESGRAYFGHYIEGDVNASDFGEYTASGNVAKTLDADLAQHIIRLNKIRAAVPALRKGQYTFDGCSAYDGWAFKRAYKDESYALVAIGGGATFTGVPAGNYVDVVTGQSYTVSTDGTVRVTAPAGQGQLRVLVKDWTGGKVGDDGMFIYTTSPVAKGGSVKFEDPGTTQFYTSEDAVGQPTVKFSPASGAFKTPTLTVTATLSESATSGWYKVGDGPQTSLTPGVSSQFTIGEGMQYGESVTVTWGADSYTGHETYKKVDPNAVITVHVKAPSAPFIYAWETINSSTKEYAGNWPGTKMSDTEIIDGDTFYYMSFPDVVESLNIVLNNGSGSKTDDIVNITSDVYYVYDGATSAREIEVTPGPHAPVIKANPADGTQFNNSLSVTLTVSGASTLYYTLDGTAATAASTPYSGPITLTATTTINTYAVNEVGETRLSFTYTKVDTPISTDLTVYFDNSRSRWSDVYVYTWTEGQGDKKSWPGEKATLVDAEANIWKFEIPQKWQNMIANNGSGTQSDDYTAGIINGHIYQISPNNKDALVDLGLYVPASVSDITTAGNTLQIAVEGGVLRVTSPIATSVTIANLMGRTITMPLQPGENYIDGLAPGFYIIGRQKVIIR